PAPGPSIRYSIIPAEEYTANIEARLSNPNTIQIARSPRMLFRIFWTKVIVVFFLFNIAKSVHQIRFTFLSSYKENRDAEPLFEFRMWLPHPLTVVIPFRVNYFFETLVEILSLFSQIIVD